MGRWYLGSYHLADIKTLRSPGRGEPSLPRTRMHDAPRIIRASCCLGLAQKLQSYENGGFLLGRRLTKAQP
jgi:hypothetical protein